MLDKISFRPIKVSKTDTFPIALMKTLPIRTVLLIYKTPAIIVLGLLSAKKKSNKSNLLLFLIISRFVSIVPKIVGFQLKKIIFRASSGY